MCNSYKVAHQVWVSGFCFVWNLFNERINEMKPCSRVSVDQRTLERIIWIMKKSELLLWKPCYRKCHWKCFWPWLMKPAPLAVSHASMRGFWDGFLLPSWPSFGFLFQDDPASHWIQVSFDSVTLRTSNTAEFLHGVLTRAHTAASERLGLFIQTSKRWRGFNEVSGCPLFLCLTQCSLENISKHLDNLCCSVLNFLGFP